MASMSESGLNGCRWMVLGAICAATVAVRFHRVTEPDHVCWDETHFGKMGSWYINRTFFFDVHPPLGKMLIGLSGYLTGYDGTFPFDKPGDKYGNVSYAGMRIFCTAMGATIVPAAFLIVDEMTRSTTAAALSSLLILFDVGLVTLTQYILLDPILLCFALAALLGAVKVRAAGPRAPFTAQWWAWLALAGTALSCCVSVKFVGLFAVLLVGLMAAADLWTVLGDVTQPISLTLKHLAARTLLLIVWPLCLYTALFYIHLTVLHKSGNGDGFYSSAFQSRLVGNSLHGASMPRSVAYGATVTLKNRRTGGGYLHSHHHLYPEGVGARQQQVTTYTHKDENNRWTVKRFDGAERPGDAVRIVRSGDLVRLEHVATRRNLHSHREPAPLTRKHLQVTGYGENGTGDANDVWRIVVLDGGGDAAEVTAVDARLRLVHYIEACALTTSGRQLPKWGYEQQEVSCGANVRDAHAVWNVEENVFARLPNVSFAAYAPGFVERLVESHAVMFQGNAGLKPKEGEVTSRPWQWPINYRGQFFSGSDHRIYLLGNPVVWWPNLAFLAVFAVAFSATAVRRRRGRVRGPDPASDAKLDACSWLFVGWLLHYVPFWAMGRVLYFHHYFPAAVLNSMLTGIAIDYVLDGALALLPSRRLAATVRHTVVASVVGGLAYSFALFSPLAYGMSGPHSNEPSSPMHGLRWLDSWEF